MDVIDFHAHIVPRADHGSSSLKTTLKQLELAKDAGVSRIIATPHFYPQVENPEDFLNRRDACYRRVVAANFDDLPEIKLGSEVLICDNIEEMPMLDKLCVSGTKILLLELPFTDFSDGYIQSVRTLISNGYTVVLAHADRYDHTNINKLIGVGARVQLNASSVARMLVPRHIKSWIESKKVFAIGSDIHGDDKGAYKRFCRAVKRLGNNISAINEYSETAWNATIKTDVN